MELTIAAWWLALGLYIQTFDATPPDAYINTHGILVETIDMREAVERGEPISW